VLHQKRISMQHFVHQQVYNLLAGFSAFLDLPPVGKPKAAINTYRRSINILNLISNLVTVMATFWEKRPGFSACHRSDFLGLCQLVPAGASPKQEIVDRCNSGFQG
jgi:hypothetical protein